MNHETHEKHEKGMEQYFFRASAEDFKKIPGSPIVYHVGKAVYYLFSNFPQLIDLHHVCSGLQTGDNDRYLRQWFEVNSADILSDENMIDYRDDFHWYFHRKGGEFRKWFGNIDYILDWMNDGENIRSSKSARPQNLERWFSTGVTWSHTSSASFSARLLRRIDTINVEGPSAFADNPEKLLGYLSSKTAYFLMGILNPTLHFLVGSVSQLPFKANAGDSSIVRQLAQLGKFDWDFYETSWDFTDLPLLQSDYRQPALKATYQKLRARWREMTLEMQRLEEENNRIFIEAYGLQDELTPEIPLNEITLTCNPHYRYGGNKTERKLEALLLADTMREFISYAVGCMFGRYALEKPGLILANQGETIEDYYKKLNEPQIDTDEHGLKKQKNICVNPCSSVVQNLFPADDDNVIPMLDGDWFTDDITERFYKFLRVTFGENHYEENLRFIEKALNIKGKRNYTIRHYFLKEFYNDHVKRYKKRPIYWLFSSPKGSFNALIYMHRYRQDTVSVILNDYLREFRTKLVSEKNRLEAISINAGATAGEKTRALKAIEKINKIISELEEYEREVLYPLATRKLEIDLDDGVKVNYQKFGKALKKVTGLSRK